MDAQTITAVASAGVATLSAAVSIYYSQRSTQHAQRSAQTQYEDHMREWAERTVDITGRLVHVLSNPGDERANVSTVDGLLADLSCQIDKGRWYFPNIHTDRKGDWKPPAYRGIRQPILNGLVDLYGAASSCDWSDCGPALLIVSRLHREFVSEVQKRLNPATRDANYQKFVGQYTDLNSQFVLESLSRPDRRPADPEIASSPESGDSGERQ